MSRGSYIEIIQETSWESLPGAVQKRTRQCLRDILATGAGSMALPTMQAMRNVVPEQYGEGRCPVWFTELSSSLVGASFFNALLVDALDSHDGFRPNKGHAGATVVPVVLSAAAERNVRGSKLLWALAWGYEIALRAGMILHAHYKPAYHSSGAWASLGAAVGGALVRGLEPEIIDRIVGIAEFYGPMSPMQRVIAAPGMVKDGAAGGAWAAATALALRDYAERGIDSLLIDVPEATEVMGDLGGRWYILEQYFKAYPTCRWTHPVIAATTHLQKKYTIDVRRIERIDVETFKLGSQLVAFPPTDTDTAQYSTPWAVAARLIDGSLSVPQVHPRKFSDPDILRLGAKVFCRSAADLEEVFPEQCLARVAITLDNGQTYHSDTMSSGDDYPNCLDEEALRKKFFRLMEMQMDTGRAAALYELIENLENHSGDDLLGQLSLDTQVTA